MLITHFFVGFFDNEEYFDERTKDFLSSVDEYVFVEKIDSIFQFPVSATYECRKVRVLFDNYIGDIVRTVCQLCSNTVLEGSKNCTNKPPHNQKPGGENKEELCVNVVLKDSDSDETYKTVLSCNFLITF